MGFDPKVDPNRFKEVLKMTTHGFSQFILNNKVQSPEDVIDEAAAKDVAQLISGSFIYRLCERLIEHDYDMLWDCLS